jgi:metal-responsive CopG/Arc/MetJ family transcriptional regulator
MPDRTVFVGVRLEPAEVEALDAAAAHEERSRSDVIRRAIRAYAEALGVLPKRDRKGK